MKRAFPQMRLLFRSSWGVCWQGPLRGADFDYEVRILYLNGNDIGRCEVAAHCWFPEVVIVDPPLRKRHGDNYVPHVYDTDGEPILCLFDARAEEWDQGMSVADTIIPWAAKWLFFYELWLATGQWEGGGRHPDARDRKAQQCVFPSVLATTSRRRIRLPDDLREPSRNDANRFLGPWTKNSGYFQSTEEESAESCLRDFSRRLKRLIWEMEASATTLISLWELQREGSSPSVWPTD
jgi:hypothetical protein